MAPTKDELRELIRKRLKEAGFKGEEELSVPSTKKAYREVHRLSREHEIEKRRSQILKAWDDHGGSFAEPHEVSPPEIEPEIEFIERGARSEHELWRLARFYWSLPYSRGYGRQIRYLVWDKGADRLMGIGGLQSPPLDFSPRDHLIEYPDGKKTFYVNQTMDAFTVGAIPPYSTLLGGKLVAMSLASNEVRREYRDRYEGSETEMEGRVLPANLVAITTTSAYGKSAMYDRVRDSEGNTLVKPIGMIENTHGSYHFNGIYPKLKEFLQEKGELGDAHGFGTGPRVRWQVIRKALELVGLDRDLIQHNVPRQAFIVPHISNLVGYIEDEEKPIWMDRPFTELVSHWKERWCLPRWERFREIPRLKQEFESWSRDDLMVSILGDDWKDKS